MEKKKHERRHEDESMNHITDHTGAMQKAQGKVIIRRGSIPVKWSRIERTEDITRQLGWSLRDRGEEWAMRDLEKPVEQLLADIYAAHQMREEDLAEPDDSTHSPRDPVLLTLFTHARTAGMMANVARENRKMTFVLVWLTAVLTFLTVILTVLTWFIYRGH
jgi:hypothetical protein